jgi:hypothetical protein
MIHPRSSAQVATWLMTLSPILSRYFPPAPGFACATVTIRCSAGITLRVVSALAQEIAVSSSRASIESRGI